MTVTTKKCPVCEWEIKDDGRELKIGGKVVLVCCDDCARKIKANPEKYITSR